MDHSVPGILVMVDQLLDRYKGYWNHTSGEGKYQPRDRPF